MTLKLLGVLDSSWCDFDLPGIASFTNGCKYSSTHEYEILQKHLPLLIIHCTAYTLQPNSSTIRVLNLLIIFTRPLKNFYWHKIIICDSHILSSPHPELVPHYHHDRPSLLHHRGCWQQLKVEPGRGLQLNLTQSGRWSCSHRWCHRSPSRRSQWALSSRAWCRRRAPTASPANRQGHCLIVYFYYDHSFMIVILIMISSFQNKDNLIGMASVNNTCI